MTCAHMFLSLSQLLNRRTYACVPVQRSIYGYHNDSMEIAALVSAIAAAGYIAIADNKITYTL